MRLRFIALLPIAVGVTFLLFMAASSIVSALERALLSSTSFGGPAPYRLTRYESECDVLFREIHALSHSATRCAAAPECQDSPLLCARTQDDELDEAYERLREALNEECDVPLGLLDFAWDFAEEESFEAENVSHGCGGAHVGWESATRGQGAPARFVF